MYSASTVFHCVIRGSYADGTVVPHAHLWADQQYVFTNTLLHSVALVDFHFFAPRRAQQRGYVQALPATVALIAQVKSGEHKIG